MPPEPRTRSSSSLDLLDAAVDSAAVGFELGFTGPAGSDAAAQAGHRRAMSGQARQQVVELREFDLQLAFPGPRAAGEDIEDQLGAVEDFTVERLFEIALLGAATARDRK